MCSARLDGLPTKELGGGVRVVEARTIRSRLLGLAGLDDLPPGTALLFPRCRSVHTFGMRFALDLLFLDRRGRAVRVVEDLPPRRARISLRARAVVEARAGEVERFIAAGLGAPVPCSQEAVEQEKPLRPLGPPDHDHQPATRDGQPVTLYAPRD